MVQAQKKIALLHRYPADRIKETNAAFPYLQAKGIDVLTFKKFDRTGKIWKHIKSFFWIFYAPLLVWGRGYDVIYCDDSYPFYPIFVRLACPKAKIVLRLGDLHLMYYFSGWVYKLLHFFEKIGWQMANRRLAISSEMAEYVNLEIRPFMYRHDKHNKIYMHSHVGVILDPVDPKNFPMDGFKNEGTVMFHGVLTRNKNVDIFLEAARRLHNVNFIIIGDGPDRERLKSNNPGNVSFKKWVPFEGIHRYIGTCGVGVALRSDNPGNDYVVTSPFLQYGIMGKPCLVSRRKVFRDYPWQFSGVSEMVEKLKYLLKHPEEGEKLRQYVLENHDAEKIAGEIWSVLSS